MKETRFIAQNKEKWLESENLLKQRDKDPEKLTTLFTQVIDDLSYSRTFYPNRSVRVYLNKIGREYFSIIYDRRRDRKNQFKLFWLDELPQIVIHSRKPILISLAIFILAAAIGIFSSMNDPQFTSIILTEQYVNMTKENIAKGDPMAVYKEGNQLNMFLGITLNNLRVSFRTYVMGVFFSIGTVAILLYNGIMVGCFQFFFIERGLFAESAMTIWLHGTLEISSIILAGGAGLTLGSGLIFPGTYSRLQAFQISAIRSLKLMLGISPIFVLAAIIESFLTRYTEAPDAVRLLLILLSFGLIIGYFVIYPWQKAKKGFDHPLEEVSLPVTVVENIHVDRIKGNAELVKDSFLFYKKHGYRLLPWITITSLVASIVNILLTEQEPMVFYENQWLEYLVQDLYFGMKTPSIEFIILNAVGTGVIIFKVMQWVDKERQPSTNAAMSILTFIQIVLAMGLLYTILYTLNVWGVLIIAFAFISLLILCFVVVTERSNIFSSVTRVAGLVSQGFGQVVGLQFILVLISISFLLLLSAPVLYLNIEVLEWNFARTDVWAQNIIEFVQKFVKIFGFYLILPIIVAAAIYLYFSLQEISTAANLKKAIGLIGTKTTKSKKR